MAEYTLRRVSRVTEGKTIRPESKVDAGDIFITRWRLSTGRVVEQEVTAEEYATRRDKNHGPMPNRTGDPAAVYLGGWAEFRFDTPSGRMEPGDVWDAGERIVLTVPGIRGGDVVLKRADVDGSTDDLRTLTTTRVPGLTLRDGVAVVEEPRGDLSSR